MVYSDIIINPDQTFSIIEQSAKPQERNSALATLERIEYVMKQGLSLATKEGEEPLTEEQVCGRLQALATRIKDGFENKRNKSWGAWFAEKFGSTDTKRVTEVNDRIQRNACYMRIPAITLFHGHEYLTGDVVEVEYTAAVSPALRHNLKAAKKIIDKVQNTIVFSYNHPRRSPVLRTLAEEAKAGNEDCKKEFMHHWTEIGEANLRAQEGVEKMQKHKQEGIGNCAAMAHCGASFAKEQDIDVKECRIEGGDHAFLQLGEGKDAVICDPWSGGCFPLVVAKRYLKNYVGVARNMDGGFQDPLTRVEPFNPAKHTIVGLQLKDYD